MHSLTVQQVSKQYPNGTQALSDVGFDIRAGEVVVLLGPNGSGKSTLFRSMVGLEKVTSGNIAIGGVDITKAKGKALRKMRTQVGLMFQKFNLVDSLTVFHNVLLGAMGRSRNPLNWWPMTASEAERVRVMECLERVKLAHVADRRASALSGGQQQRVALARMLMQDPQIFLADEPVASLDPRAGKEVMDLLWDIAKERGLTVVCTLHQLDFAMEYADRMIGLRAGHLVLDRSAAEIDRSTLESLYGMEKDLDSRLQAELAESPEESRTLVGGLT